MLSPDNTVIVLMDADGGEAAPEAVEAKRRIIDCAQALALPIVRVLYPGATPAPTPSGSQFPKEIDHAFIVFQPVSAEWQKTTLATTLLATGRRQLLISGDWLEEGVSLLAHHAMRAGMDTYVCIDACSAIRPDQEPILLARLVQHNIVVTTCEQVVREWLALCSNAKRDIVRLLVEKLPSDS